MPGIIQRSLSRQSTWASGVPVPYSRSLEHSTIRFVPVRFTRISSKIGFCTNFSRMPGRHKSAATLSHFTLSTPFIFLEKSLQSAEYLHPIIWLYTSRSPKYFALEAWIYCSLEIKLWPSKVKLAGKKFDNGFNSPKYPTTCSSSMLVTLNAFKSSGKS